LGAVEAHIDTGGYTSQHAFDVRERNFAGLQSLERESRIVVSMFSPCLTDSLAKFFRAASMPTSDPFIFNRSQSCVNGSLARHRMCRQRSLTSVKSDQGIRQKPLAPVRRNIQRAVDGDDGKRRERRLHRKAQ